MEKGTIKRLELAKTGQFGIDGASLTLQDLQEAVETFEGTPPVSIGHQMAKEDWFPRFGSILTVDLTEDDDGGGVLFGDVEMNETLSDAYDQGFYTGWSISLPKRASDGKRYIHHLAFLGAVPPKIRDLKVLDELRKTETVDMSECNGKATFAFVAGDFTKAGGKGMPGEKDKKKEAPQGTPETIELSDELKAKLARSDRIYKEGNRSKITAAAEGVIPKDKHGLLLELSDSLAEAPEYEFSDEQGKVKRSPIDVLVDVLKSIPRAAGVLETELNFSDVGGGRGTVEEVNTQDMVNHF